MRPSDLIKKDLGKEIWAECSRRLPPSGDLPAATELSPFESPKTYVVHGKSGQFDFGTLPHGSYCIYVADGRRAVRLTRAGKEVESVLKENWSALADCDPVVVARLILTFFDNGMRSTHQVLPNVESLRAYPKDYAIDEREFESSQGLVGRTSMNRCDDSVVIRAVTVCGWMHDKQNLGIEHIHISKSGEVRLEERQVLSKKIFKSVPQIRY